MAYVPPKYPGAIPTIGDLPDRADDVDWMYAARYNELKKELRAIMTELGTDPAGASADVKTRLGLLALKANVLELDNTTPFTPDADHEPATKKYVDDTAGVGDVTSAANITEHSVVRGADGAKGVELSTVFISDAGEMTNTSQPAFQARLTGHQSNIAINSTVTVLFASEVFDQGNNFNTGTYTFTAPVTGKYILTYALFCLAIDQAATVFYTLQLVTSNHTYSQYWDTTKFSADLDNMPFVFSIVADMDANDTALVTFKQTNGTAQTDIRLTSYFSGALLC